MKIFSPSFKNGEMIDKEFTCQGKNINPEILIYNIPLEAKSLALIIDDPDAPGGTFVHWVVFNIAPNQKIDKNSIPGKQGRNDFNRNDYGGPCPPNGTHCYYFKLYALDIELLLEEGVTKENLEDAMKGHILAQAEITGLYRKC